MLNIKSIDTFCLKGWFFLQMFALKYYGLVNFIVVICGLVICQFYVLLQYVIIANKHSTTPTPTYSLLLPTGWNRLNQLNSTTNTLPFAYFLFLCNPWSWRHRHCRTGGTSSRSRWSWPRPGGPAHLSHAWPWGPRWCTLSCCRSWVASTPGMKIPGSPGSWHDPPGGCRTRRTRRSSADHRLPYRLRYPQGSTSSLWIRINGYSSLCNETNTDNK